MYIPKERPKSFFYILDFAKYPTLLFKSNFLVKKLKNKFLESKQIIINSLYCTYKTFKLLKKTTLAAIPPVCA